MAARKKSEAQASLFAPAPAKSLPLREPEPEPEERSPRPYMPFPPSLAPHANEVDQPAPPVREVERKSDGVSVVRHMSGQFLVQRVRDNGTTFAGAFYTRAELEQFIAGATEALK